MPLHSNPDICKLFAAIDAATATHPDPRAYLQMQADGWARREAAFMSWVKNPGRRAHPLPGLDAFGVAFIRAEIETRLAAFERAAA